MQVRVKRVHPDAVLPQYAHSTDSGFDLVAVEDVIVEPGQTVKVPTGLAFQLSPNFELQVRPKSGVTSKTKLRVQFGTIDAGYRGEVSVIVDNIRSPSYDITKGPNGSPRLLTMCDDVIGLDGSLHDIDGGYLRGSYIIRKGDKIAQGIIAPVIYSELIEVDELSSSSRGTGGFGSSGIR